MTAARACTCSARAVRCRRRHQPRRPPPAKMRRGKPAPAMGGGDCQEYRLDAAMIFPVNKIPISTVIEGRGAQEMVALVLRRRIGPIRALHPHNRRKQEVDMLTNGAQVEGSVIAQNVTICGRVKGTIRADRVKLQNGGAVEGDIFHRTLSIDENSQFEGSSRRVENPTEPSSSVDAKGPQKKGTAPAPLPSINAELADGPK